MRADASGGGILKPKKQEGAQVFQDRLQECASATQGKLDEVFASMPGGPVRDAMAYATCGGKRLRAFLAMESARMHGVDDAASVWAGAAIEAMHAYSLVHDDLPSMDNDDLRRGQPTVHVKWDDATAVLVGDALQALSFELLTDPGLSLDAQARLDLCAGLARAAGGQGMVRGQALDIAAEGAAKPYSIEMVEETQALKTGALIEWSANVGPTLAGADPKALAQYATALGRAFQIADDILDVTGNEAATGKRVGKDDAAGKATFVSLLGLDGARARANLLVETACDVLQPYGPKADNLRAAARFVIARQT